MSEQPSLPEVGTRPCSLALAVSVPAGVTWGQAHTWSQHMPWV